MREEQQVVLLDHQYLIIISVLWDSLPVDLELNVEVAPITMENSQNPGQIVVVLVVT